MSKTNKSTDVSDWSTLNWMLQQIYSHSSLSQFASHLFRSNWWRDLSRRGIETSSNLNDAQFINNLAHWLVRVNVVSLGKQHTRTKMMRCLLSVCWCHRGNVNLRVMEESRRFSGAKRIFEFFSRRSFGKTFSTSIASGKRRGEGNINKHKTHVECLVLTSSNSAN